MGEGCMKKGKYIELIYTYWHERDGYNRNFSHPEIRVYKANYYRGQLSTWLGDNLFDLRAQCDEERGHSLFKCYALKVEMSCDYEITERIKLLAKVLDGTASYRNGLIPAIRNLRKLGAVRYSLADVGQS